MAKTLDKPIGDNVTFMIYTNIESRNNDKLGQIQSMKTIRDKTPKIMSKLETTLNYSNPFA